MKALLAGITMTFLSVCTAYTMTGGNGLKEEFHKSYPLASKGTISLQNVNGDVEIKVWDKNEVKVDAVKYADDQEDMDQLKIEVDATQNSVDIDTQYPDEDHSHGHHGSVSVDYILTVPKDAELDEIKTVNGSVEISGSEGSVRASSVNGSVEASGLKASCELKSVNGKVSAEFVSLPSDTRARLGSVNGTVTIKIPADANASVKASTQSGHVSNDFGLTSYEKHHDDWGVRIGDSIKGDIGKGGADVDLNTVNGSVRILKNEGSN